MQLPLPNSATLTNESRYRSPEVRLDAAPQVPDVTGGSGAKRLFQQDWWLQASGGDRLQRVEVIWDGKVVASLCYVKETAYGLRLLKLPPYTRTHGPMLSLPPSKPAKYKRNLRRAVQGLMDALPKHDRFHLYLDPADPCVFPFALAGCAIEQDFTFRLPAGTDIEAHWNDLDQKTRNLIRTASKKLEIQHTCDLELLLEMVEREHVHTKNRHRFEPLRRIADATFERKQSTILLAKDESGRPVAVAMLIWDDELLYYWQSSRDPATSVAGANSVLVWEAIKFAVGRGLGFDFDGYHSPAAALFADKFGIEPIARPSITHMTTMGFIARNLALRFGRKPGI